MGLRGKKTTLAECSDCDTGPQQVIKGLCYRCYHRASSRKRYDSVLAAAYYKKNRASRIKAARARNLENPEKCREHRRSSSLRVRLAKRGIREDRKQLVLQHLREGKTVLSVSSEFSIACSTLYRWLAENAHS